MAVDQADVVDAVGVEKSTGRIVLNLIDQLPFEQEEEHLLMLQEKLNSYLAFVEGGQLLESYPDAQGRELVISVTFRYQPSAQARSFLERAKQVVGQVGISLEWQDYPGLTQ